MVRGSRRLRRGVCPGGVEHVSTYALQWVNACVEYYRMTGDRTLLEELFGYAENNIRYFESKLGVEDWTATCTGRL